MNAGLEVFAKGLCEKFFDWSCAASICLIFAVLMFGIAKAESRYDSSEQAVNSGALEAERITLLKEIREASEMGVGTKTYMTAFKDLERLVEIGASKESIQARLMSISSALNEQLGLRATKLQNFKGPEKLLNLNEARQYVLQLVNADRAKYHLPPLILDAVACRAGQIHSDEMAVMGYLSHWDLAGKKPWQRYVEVGGTHDIGENVVLLRSTRDQRKSSDFVLTKNGSFCTKELELMESSLFNEKPPNDGHRLEILTPEHNKLGVGLSCATNSKGMQRWALVQEFVKEYGFYSKLPKKLERGQTFELSGALVPGLKLDTIEVFWEPTPKPSSVDELEAMPKICSIQDTGYPEDSIPPSIKRWMKDGSQHFSMRIVPGLNWKSGVYYIEVWAEQNDKSFVVSTRTVCLP